MTKRYAGVGNRKTPPHMLQLIKQIGYTLALKGYTLSSGGCNGPDDVFEQGCDVAKGKKEIWLPWKGYNKKQSTLITNETHTEIAKEIHPSWTYLTQGTKKLMSRNVGEVLGEDGKSPVDFVVCYTEDGAEHYSQVTAKTGGTGFAILLASRQGIPVFNLKNENALSRLKLFLNEYQIFED